MKQKDPSAVAVRNNQLFGLDSSYEEAKLVSVSIPWDVTTSYRPGTVAGPDTILEASYQLDLVSPLLPEAWNLPLYTLPANTQWLSQSKQLRPLSEKHIQVLEQGGEITGNPELEANLRAINQACAELASESEAVVTEQLNNNKLVLTLGGDHAISFGPIAAYSKKYSDLSILHFDAHADLRQAYEGFLESHASIMYNVMDRLPIYHLVQVGIRDVSPVELEYSRQHSAKISTHLDWQTKNQLANGATWAALCKEMLAPLSQNVYISFDIDGLDPKLCPHTGTPVPGGLDLWQVQFMIETLLASGRKIVGADLVEVAPGPEGDEWDGNVGARCAFMLACAIMKSNS